jgi:hypothetical protein
MNFLRRSWKQKPKQWGPYNRVQSSLFHNAERIGIDPAFYRLALPFWGPGFQKDYISEKGFNLNAQAIWNRNRLNLIETKIDTGIPSFQSDSMTIIMDLNSDRNNQDGGILDTKGGYDYWGTPKGFSINLRGYLPSTDGGLLFAVGSNATVVNNGPLFDLKKMHNLACVFKASVKRQIFFNGKEPSYDSQGADLSGFALGSNYVIGSYYNYEADLRRLKGRIGNIVIFSTDLSPDTVSEFNDNPYQLWQRVPPVFYSVPSGAGGLTLSQQLSWKIRTVKESSTAWNVLNQASQSTAWQLLTRSTVNAAWRVVTELTENLAWKILNSEDFDTSWKVLKKDEQEAAWKIKTQQEQDTEWKIKTGLSQEAAWKIKTQQEQDTEWKIKTGLSQEAAWKIKNSTPANTSWKIFSKLDQDIAWRILTSGILEQDTSWRILTSDNAVTGWQIKSAVDTETAWKIATQEDQDVSWKIKTETEQDTAWRILTGAYLEQEISWKILRVDDQDLAWHIKAQAEQDTAWKIYTKTDQDIGWGILADDIPDAVFEFTKQARTFIFNKQARTFIFFK